MPKPDLFQAGQSPQTRFSISSPRPQLHPSATVGLGVLPPPAAHLHPHDRASKMLTQAVHHASRRDGSPQHLLGAFMQNRDFMQNQTYAPYLYIYLVIAVSLVG